MRIIGFTALKYPNFIIFGAGKSGSTSLYHYLRQHPDVFMSKIKEPNWFMRGSEKSPPVEKQDIEIRVDCYKSYLDLFQGAEDEKAIGEASISYIWSEGAAEKISEKFPEIKLIAILRNPIRAFFSGYQMFVRDGFITKSFDSVIRETRESRFNRNLYFSNINMYLNYFCREQIKVLLYDDFKVSPHEVLKDIFHFLNIAEDVSINVEGRFNVGSTPKNRYFNQFLKKPSVLKEGLKRVFPKSALLKLKNAVNERNQSNKKEEMSEEAFYFLKEKFKADIIKLEELLNRDLSDWLNKDLVLRC